MITAEGSCATQVSRRKAALIHRAGAGAARVAAGPARAAWAGGFLRFLSAYGEAGKLLAQPLALTFGACGFLVAQDDGFKLMMALLADVFENRHIRMTQLKL
jgi:hypothetical protein